MAQYMTKQRSVLLSFLKDNEDRGLTALQIYEALKNDGISQSAVYRNLSALEKSGQIHKVARNDNNETLYRYSCEHSECHNTIHLSCQKCGKMYHLESEGTNELLNRLFKSQGFSVDKEKSVLYGICNSCK